MVGTSRGYPRGYEDRDDRAGIMRKWDWRFGGRQPDPIWVHAQPRCPKRLKELIDAGETKRVHICCERIFPMSRKTRTGTPWLQLPEEEGNEDEANSLRELQVVVQRHQRIRVGSLGCR